MAPLIRAWPHRHPTGYRAAAVATLMMASFGVLGLAAWGLDVH